MPLTVLRYKQAGPHSHDQSRAQSNDNQNHSYMMILLRSNVLQDPFAESISDTKRNIFCLFASLRVSFPELTAGVVCCDCIVCTWELDLDLCTLALDGWPFLIFTLILIALSIALGKYESWCSCNTVS
jgi:hypothetical protein